MKKTVLQFLLDPYSDWESAYVSPLIHAIAGDRYTVKTISLTGDPVKSLGGLTVLPDATLASVPAQYEALLLIGGLSWRTPAARQVEPLVRRTLEEGRILGGICDAAGFLATLGVLNGVRHTGNGLDDIKQWAGDAYTGEQLFEAQPAVRDQNIITANGTAPLEFAREVLTALHAAPEEKIMEWYRFHKLGWYEAPMPQG